MNIFQFNSYFKLDFRRSLEYRLRSCGRVTKSRPLGLSFVDLCLIGWEGGAIYLHQSQSALWQDKAIQKNYQQSTEIFVFGRTKAEKAKQNYMYLNYQF